MLNSLEKKLQSWVPRHPSPEIARGLFDTAQPVESFSLAHWSWLAPATAVFLGALVFLSAFHMPGRSADEHGPAVVSMMLSAAGSSNVDQSSWVSGALSLTKLDVNLEWNVWREAIFDWTNGSQSTSSMGFSSRLIRH